MDSPTLAAAPPAPAFSTDAADAATASASQREPLKGWVLKKKSEGSRSRILGSANRRFYTIDFPGQVVFYGHAEDSKSVSCPVHFSQLLSVEATSNMAPPPEQGADAAGATQEKPEMRRSDSKGSLSGTLRARMPSLASLSRRPVEQHCLLVNMVGKTTELAFESKAEADVWLEAFQAAVDLGAAARSSGAAPSAFPPPEPSTAPGSSAGGDETSTSPTPRSAGDAGAFESEAGATAATSAGAAPSTVPNSTVEEIVVVEPEATPAAAAASTSSSAPATKAPSTFLVPPTPPAAAATFEGEIDITSPTATSSPSVAAAAVPVAAVGAAAANCGAPGADAGDGSSSSRTGGDVAAAWGLPGGDKDSRRAVENQRKAAQRFGDKGEGLTLQERLAQLDFSDDEEDDDENDPTAAARRKLSARKSKDTKAAGGGAAAQVEETAVEAVTVDQCQAFVLEADSDED